MIPACVATVALFLMVAENVMAWPLNGWIGLHEMLVTVRSTPTSIGSVSLLLFSLVSPTRFTSSSQASTVCGPEPGDQVALPEGPLLAVTVMLWPGASAAVLLSDQLTSVPPSTRKPTPLMVP